MARIEFQRLGGPILTGRVGGRRLDCVACLSKDVKDFLAATKFSSKGHHNITGITSRSSALGESLDGGALERIAAP